MQLNCTVVLFTVKSCVKAAAYVQFFDFSGWLMHSSCAIISSIHSAKHACRVNISHTMHNKMSQLQAAAIIQERLMRRHAVAKVRLLFKGSFCTRLRYM